MKETIRVYKYHKIDEHLLQLFSLNALYCCTPEQLNDPLEGKINLNEEFLNNLFHNYGEWQINYIHYTLWFEFLNRAEKDLEVYMLLDRYKPKLGVEDLSEIPIKDKIEIILSYRKTKELFTDVLLKEYNIRIISLSKFDLSNKADREKEKLMWSYYSGASKGVRLTFDFDSPMESNFSEIEPIYFEPVIYESEMPVLKTEKELFECFRFKYEIWNRENEHRIMIRNQKGIGYAPERLKEVTFGLNVEEVMVIAIVRLCEKLDYKCDYKQLKYIDGNLEEQIIPREAVDTFVELRDRTDFRIEI